MKAELCHRDKPGSFTLSAPDILTAAAVELSNCIRTLDMLATSTEDEFLYIGSRLRDFHSRTSQITGSASSVAGLISGEEISATVRELNTLMERMAFYLKQCESMTSAGTAKLKQVKQRLTAIQLHLEGLGRIAKVLRMLALSNAVQNAVLTNPVEGIRVLGEDVKSFSAKISDKSGNIGGSIQSMLAYLNKILSRLGDFETVGHNKAQTIMRSTVSSIHSLNEKYSLSADTARAISKFASQIYQGIGAIVTSLQFHDITRQQFEGSKSAFEKMIEKIRSGDSGGETGEEIAGQAELLYSITTFCVSQMENIRLTGGEFVSAIESAVDNLRLICSDVRNMLRMVAGIVGAEGSAETPFLSAVQAGLSSVSATLSTLSEKDSLRKELSGAVEHAGETITDMAGFISEIEEIGEDVELIALNASAKASIIGAEGKPLDVIAAEIRRVSVETQDHTNSIAEHLKSILSLTSEMSEETGSEAAEYDSEGITMSENMERLVNSLYQVNERVVSLLAEVKEKVSSVSEEIEETTGKITVHKLVGTSVKEILGALERISASIEKRPSDLLTFHYYPGEEVAVRSGTVQGVKTRLGSDSDKYRGNVELF